MFGFAFISAASLWLKVEVHVLNFGKSVQINHKPPCLYTMCAGEAVIENNWVAEMTQIKSSPFQEKVKILLWHVLRMISSLRVDVRLARMPLKLVAITVALILTVAFSLTL